MVFNMTNVYIVSTPYHLLISIVKTILANRVGQDIIIIYKKNISSSTIKNVQKFFKEVYGYNQMEILFNLICLKISLSKIQPLFFFLKQEYGIDKKWFQKKEIFLFNDHSYFGCLLNAYEIDYNLIEDGLDSFKPQKQRKICAEDLLYKLLGFSWDYWGTSKYIKSIEVNDGDNLSVNHSNIIVQNREQMFKKLAPEQIDIIACVFGYKPLKNVELGEKTLLLTQPLSEDSLVNHEIKIHIYKHLVDKYATGKLYIKVHPREKEDYKKQFPDAIILGNQAIPFEVYQLKEKFHFNKAITVFSTAINAVFCADEKVSMSPEWMMNFSKKS